jgi:glutathione S-transferase
MTGISMITLHSFGAGMKLPDPSPFVLKAEMLLKISGLPYRKVMSDVRKAPKGKIPFIEDQGQTIADTTFIRLYLERKHGIDFDKGLTAEQKATSWAVDKLCEDHLYWGIVHDRWMTDENFERGPAHFFKEIPRLIRPVITSMVRRKLRKGLDAQGLGRHSNVEIIELFSRGVSSIAALLGEKPYMMGNSISSVDATVFGIIAGALTPIYSDSPLFASVTQHPNLMAYRDRLMKQYFPDFA